MIYESLSLLLTIIMLLVLCKEARSFTRPSSRNLLSKALTRYSVSDMCAPKNFITNIIEDDLASQRVPQGKIVTRFPPEPNGYLHLGHAKSIVFNFGVASMYNGVTHMRLDDTNPTTETPEYVQSILEDVEWLMTGNIDKNAGSRTPPWTGPVRHASDYFPVMYAASEYLIKQGIAFVDHTPPDDMKLARGTLTTPGTESPFRNRSIEENLTLFRRMKAGEFNDGDCVLRAKIDMSNSNMNLRDPTLYRIKKGVAHPATGIQWCIYPMYDYAHAISDAVEGVTHSLCTLEFEDHRPLYDWVVENLLPSGLICSPAAAAATTAGGSNTAISLSRPTQIEFSRLNLQYTVLSKRRLARLVDERFVTGWDDPRMPTLSGLRRRGFPAEALRLFCSRVGISKAENNIDMQVLEDSARAVLDHTAIRSFAISTPLKVSVTNWPRDKVETLRVPNHPKRPELSYRDMPFTNELFIDREDFFDVGADESLTPPKGYKRLVRGGSVRLKHAFVVTCTDVVRDSNTGEVIELICYYDPLSKSTNSVATTGPSTDVQETSSSNNDDNSSSGSSSSKKDKRAPVGVIQWVSARYAMKASLACFDRLFLTAAPMQETNSCISSNIRSNSSRSNSFTSAVDSAVITPSISIQNTDTDSERDIESDIRSDDNSFIKNLNPDSLVMCDQALVEPSLATAKPGDVYQFERVGYFAIDSYNNTTNTDNDQGRVVFNRIVTLRDTWGKTQEALVANTVSNVSNSNSINNNNQNSELNSVNKNPDNQVADSKERSSDGSDYESSVRSVAATEVTFPTVGDIQQLEWRVGAVKSAIKHPDADSLYVLKVDVGAAGGGERTIVTGLAGRVPLSAIEGHRVVIVCNLKPVKMRGIMSNGMALAAVLPAAGTEKEQVEIVSPPSNAAVGELLQLECYGAPSSQVLSKSLTVTDLGGDFPVLKTKGATKHVWPRISSGLRTNEQCEVVLDVDIASSPAVGITIDLPSSRVSCRLVSASGPCKAPSLQGAIVR